LLWDAATLKEIASPSEAVDLRGFLALAVNWPEDLPSCEGDSLIVTGMEGVLDSLDGDELEAWLADDLRPAMLGFQEEYESQAGLIMWLPSGGKRIEMDRATEHYYWKPHGRARIPLGQMLWGGAEADVERILISDEPNPDSDGHAWCGLFHPRIS
jgi:hypothetical protein